MTGYGQAKRKNGQVIPVYITESGETYYHSHGMEDNGQPPIVFPVYDLVEGSFEASSNQSPRKFPALSRSY
jgi:hypothetical protein